MHTLELLITVACAVLGSNGLWAYLQIRHSKGTSEDKMLLGLGHSEIFRLCSRYLERGAVTKEELEDLMKYLYAPYKALGGNGTGETLVTKVRALPVIKADEALELDEAGK